MCYSRFMGAAWQSDQIRESHCRLRWISALFCIRSCPRCGTHSLWVLSDFGCHCVLAEVPRVTLRDDIVHFYCFFDTPTSAAAAATNSQQNNKILVWPSRQKPKVYSRVDPMWICVVIVMLFSNKWKLCISRATIVVYLHNEIRSRMHWNSAESRCWKFRFLTEFCKSNEIHSITC